MSPRPFKIKTLFRLAALVSALLCIVVTVGVYNAFGIYQKSLSQEAFAGIVNQSAYRLTSLTGDYLVYRENRARQQWVSVHQNLAITLRQRITLGLAEGNADGGAIVEIMALNDRLGKLFALTVKHYELDKSAEASTQKSHTRGDRFASQVLSVSHQITSKADLILQQSQETVRQFGRWAGAIIVTGILLLIVFTVSVWFFSTAVSLYPFRSFETTLVFFGMINCLVMCVRLMMTKSAMLPMSLIESVNLCVNQWYHGMSLHKR